jgi:uncharacterized protein (DUF1501 family)
MKRTHLATSRGLSPATRREFLKASSALALTGTAAPFVLNLAALGQAAAQTAPSDYKALVCLFLFGGNDHYNTVLPYDDASYGPYASIRSTPPDPIARPRDTLLEIVPKTSQGAGRQFALPPELPLLKALFDAEKAAVVANVGPLIVPTTRAQYQNNSVPLPPKLFSHNDQQSVWQALGPEGTLTGWGGRFGDLLLSRNDPNRIFTCISAAGTAVWLAGQRAVQYQVSTGANVSVRITAISGASLFGGATGPAALRAIISGGGANLFQQDHATVVERSINADQVLTNALANAPAINTAFPANNTLADQLRAVARVIAGRNDLAVKRQVFFVSLGGFDTHDNQNATQPRLHGLVDAAVNAFYQATIELGVANDVTLFTASDFGRTLTSNGDGSDHGWGAHQFVVGGAVKGRDIYGQMPVVALNTLQDVGQGRLLPTTSVDQYAATLGAWFGVSAADMATVLPNLGAFSPATLGFV